MRNQDYKIKVEYSVSAIVLLVGLFFVFQAFTIETSSEAIGPRTMPMILAIALVLGGLWLAFRAYSGRTGDLKDGCGALFVALFWAFGYFFALIATFIVTLFTFGVRNWIIMVLSGVILAFAFQLLFMGVMRLNDPKGAIIDMRPYTNWITGAT
jgi:hypothetical protein